MTFINAKVCFSGTYLGVDPRLIPNLKKIWNLKNLWNFRKWWTRNFYPLCVHLTCTTVHVSHSFISYFLSHNHLTVCSSDHLSMFSPNHLVFKPSYHIIMFFLCSYTLEPMKISMQNANHASILTFLCNVLSLSKRTTYRVWFD